MRRAVRHFDVCWGRHAGDLRKGISKTSETEVNCTDEVVLVPRVLSTLPDVLSFLDVAPAGILGNLRALFADFRVSGMHSLPFFMHLVHGNGRFASKSHWKTLLFERSFRHASHTTFLRDTPPVFWEFPRVCV